MEYKSGILKFCHFVLQAGDEAYFTIADVSKTDEIVAEGIHQSHSCMSSVLIDALDSQLFQ